MKYARSPLLVGSIQNVIGMTAIWFHFAARVSFLTRSLTTAPWSTACALVPKVVTQAAETTRSSLTKAPVMMGSFPQSTCVRLACVNRGKERRPQRQARLTGVARVDAEESTVGLRRDRRRSRGQPFCPVDRTPRPAMLKVSRRRSYMSRDSSPARPCRVALDCTHPQVPFRRRFSPVGRFASCRRCRFLPPTLRSATARESHWRRDHRRVLWLYRPPCSRRRLPMSGPRSACRSYFQPGRTVPPPEP